MGFFIDEILRKMSPDYNEGVEKGFKIAESYFEKATREFFRDVKKGLLKDYATLSTITTHKCNCEFCWTNEAKKV